MNRDRLKELLEIPLSELEDDKELKLEVVEYYQRIYDKKPCTSCKNKFPQYYKELLENGLELLTEKESNFKLRTDLGVSKITFDNGQFISQTHADDDVCLGFLEANPKRITMFEKYPENWMELITQIETDNE
ncbi:hypothetical protein [Flavobacterium hibernum]|uniref:Uncharacterized protein n=1 Tax=Flavobacterium hibernum TaxID=37752 RepID=A0A0D0EDP2_9FLAO|nr:hypothetical protein [Flavobacterium hibernum]KIO50949.1 hypothetical protein IW18_20390 [Flavobacterium hibernum]OXA85190.1 hypothetical protein B0A73_17730 [Flavobacterium hibernum]STO19568.1 Uncharacterised protein [Flavobacterium hibernum]